MHLEVRIVLGVLKRHKLRLFSRFRLGSLSGGSYLNEVVVSATSLVRLGRADHYGLIRRLPCLSGSLLCLWSLGAQIWLDTDVLEGPANLQSSKCVRGLISQSPLYGIDITLSRLRDHHT